ncbi:hypothetical protein [Methylocystis sp.]|uniref:hypothetical protein n=1 Tax=Methylocystis sp. TaxID=1911079 RepID=UPI003DA68957
MPQPLSRVTPNPGQIRWSADVISDKPQIAIIVAEIIALSSTIDHHMSLLLSRILKTRTGPVIAVMARLQTQGLQRVALDAAAQSSLSADDYRIFKSAFGAVETAQTGRHKVAHWIWGSASNIPGAVLMVDPTEFNSVAASAEAEFWGWQDAQENQKQIYASKIYVFNEDAFARFKRDLIEAEEIMRALGHFLNPSEPLSASIKNPGIVALLSRLSPQTREGSLQKLSSLRLFREALGRMDAVAKNTPRFPSE